jgi:hypothetical protein
MEEECEQNDERNKQEDTMIMDKRPAAASSWSNSYLTKFLDSSKDDARTDIRNLLTQRAIQSFMRLLEECRDPHSAKCKLVIIQYVTHEYNILLSFSNLPCMN